MKATLDGATLIDDVLVAESLLERMEGLLGRAGLPGRRALLIERCGSVHTFGMNFEIDLIFLDRQDRVVKVVLDVRRSRMVFGGWRARKVLELQSGTVDLSALSAGSQLAFEG